MKCTVKLLKAPGFFFLRIKQKKGAMRFIVVFSGFFKRQPKSSSIRNVNPLSVWLNIHSFNEINPSARNKVLRTEELRGGFFFTPGSPLPAWKKESWFGDSID